MVDFFDGRRIVVTGGAGFLGSFVVDRLRDRGAVVFVPRSDKYNLVDRSDCRRLVADSEPDLVLHLAARVGGIGANRANPGRFFFDNLMMGVQLIEECRLGNVPKVLALGTICAYPKFAPTPFQEKDLWNGYPEETNAPYGLAKKMLLVQSQAYREQYGFNSLVVFPVNLYGPRDNFDLETSHVIPAMIRKCIAARERGIREVVLWGDGSPTREFLYVEDCAEAILLAAELYDSSEPVNLGSGVEISMKELAELVAGHCRYEGMFRWDTTKPNGQPRRRLDVTRAREEFGFVAKTGLAEGISKTVAWYENHRKGIDSE